MPPACKDPCIGEKRLGSNIKSYLISYVVCLSGVGCLFFFVMGGVGGFNSYSRRNVTNFYISNLDNSPRFVGIDADVDHQTHTDPIRVWGLPKCGFLEFFASFSNNERFF